MFDEYIRREGIELKKVSKNDLLQRPGKITTKAYYVKSGLLRSYVLDENDKIHVFMFAPEGWIISDIQSKALSSPTNVFIDAMEDSEVYTFRIEAFVAFNENKEEVIKKLFRRIAFMQNRLVLLMSATAKQRYEHFLETYPQLVNRVPLKLIASYLGIAPETLSSIRSKMRVG